MSKVKAVSLGTNRGTALRRGMFFFSPNSLALRHMLVITAVTVGGALYSGCESTYHNALTNANNGVSQLKR